MHTFLAVDDHIICVLCIPLLSWV